ncbi:MAG: response regulator [Limisphaerales bacterium]
MYRNIKILIADDDQNDAFLLKRAFLRAGINSPMNFVEDGEQAISYLEGRAPFADRREFPLPNLVFVDLKMPRMDGFDVLRWVRRQPGLKRLPVLVLSSSADFRDVDKAYDLGANAYAVKPSKHDELQALIMAVESYWLRKNLYPGTTTQKAGAE